MATRISYWWDGAWRQYHSAALLSRTPGSTAIFSYVPTTGTSAGQTLTAQGREVSHSVVASYGARGTLPGAVYYERIGSVGPKVFAINSGEGSDPSYTYTGEAQGGTPDIAVVDTAPKKAGLSVPLMLGLGLVFFLMLRKGK